MLYKSLPPKIPQARALSAMPLAEWRATVARPTLAALVLCLAVLLCLAGFATDAGGFGATGDRRLLIALLSGGLLGPRAGALLCFGYLGLVWAGDWLRGYPCLLPGALGLPMAALLSGWWAYWRRREHLLEWAAGCGLGALAFGIVTGLWRLAPWSGVHAAMWQFQPPVWALAIQAAMAVALIFFAGEHLRVRNRARHE